jgi:hypothetical protein
MVEEPQAPGSLTNRIISCNSTAATTDAFALIAYDVRMNSHISSTATGSQRIITPATVCREYGFSPRLLKDLRRRRRLPFVRAGHRTVLFLRTDVEAYINAHRVAAIGGERGIA